MKSKKDLLKAKRARLAVLGMCGALALTGCGCTQSEVIKRDSEERGTPDYVITYNKNNVLIFRANDFRVDNGGMYTHGSTPVFRLSSPYITFMNIEEDNVKYVYSIAHKLAGEDGRVSLVDLDNGLQDGSVTFYDVDNELKLTK